ncbi:MAG TPA: UrcA family protein [Candidatus Binataceae bacterium]
MSNHTTINRRFISIASMLIVFAGAAMSATVRAADEPQYDKTVVTYGDLNLDSQQGTKMLYARLRNGAEDVCSSIDGRNLFLKRLWQTCFDQAVAAAVVQVNSPGLTTLHNEAVNRSKGDR